MTDKNINDGHREWIRKRYIKNGLDGFQDHEILELLLFYSVSRRNTNELAHRLLDYFDGRFHSVLDASCEELMKVKGIGETTAVMLSMLPEIFRRYRESMDAEDTKLSSVEEAGAYFIPKYIGRTRETIMLACIDSQCRVINCRILTEGTVDSAPIQIRRIAEIALKFNAFGIMMAHNHPGGKPLPSREDIMMTNNIAKAMEVLGIHMMDHIIIAGEEYTSMAKSRLFHQNL